MKKKLLPSTFLAVPPDLAAARESPGTSGLSLGGLGVGGGLVRFRPPLLQEGAPHQSRSRAPAEDGVVCGVANKDVTSDKASHGSVGKSRLHGWKLI